MLYNTHNQLYSLVVDRYPTMKGLSYEGVEVSDDKALQIKSFGCSIYRILVGCVPTKFAFSFWEQSIIIYMHRVR